MLSEEEIVAVLNHSINDNMAFDSEDGGDSDADDDAINVIGNKSMWSLSTRSSSKKTINLINIFYFL